MGGRSRSSDSGSGVAESSRERMRSILPSPDGEPLTLKVRCWTSRSSKAPVTRHPVTIHPDWSVTTPHDLESERVAAAFGGYLSCLDLATRDRARGISVLERVGAGCRFPTTTRPESGPASAVADARSCDRGLTP
jgi:hypothetical protein